MVWAVPAVTAVGTARRRPEADGRQRRAPVVTVRACAVRTPLPGAPGHPATADHRPLVPSVTPRVGRARSSGRQGGRAAGRQRRRASAVCRPRTRRAGRPAPLVARPVDAEHGALRVAYHRDPSVARDVDRGVSRSPPSFRAVAASASTSATAMYGSQCGGTPGAMFSSIVSRPPRPSPSIPHCGYVSRPAGDVRAEGERRFAHTGGELRPARCARFAEQVRAGEGAALPQRQHRPTGPPGAANLPPRTRPSGRPAANRPPPSPPGPSRPRPRRRTTPSRPAAAPADRGG